MNFLVGVYEKSMPESFSLSQKLATVRKAGFDFLELSIDESDAKLARLKWSSSERSQLRREMEDNNIYLRSMCLSGHRRFPLGSIHSFDASRSLDIMQRAVDLACDLGIRVIQLAGYDTYYGISSQKTLDAFLINLEKAVEMAAKSCVILAFETMETPFMDTVSKAMAYINTVRSPFLQLYPDIGNLSNAAILYGHDIISDLRLGSGHIVMMHLKESRPGVYRNLFYGEGSVDFSQCAAFLRDEGVRSVVSELWYREGEDPLGYLQKANRIVHNYLLTS